MSCAYLPGPALPATLPLLHGHRRDTSALERPPAPDRAQGRRLGLASPRVCPQGLGRTLRCLCPSRGLGVSFQECTRHEGLGRGCLCLSGFVLLPCVPRRWEQGGVAPTTGLSEETPRGTRRVLLTPGTSPAWAPPLTTALAAPQALQAPACHENLVKVGGYILGEFGNLIAGDPRSR